MAQTVSADLGAEPHGLQEQSSLLGPRDRNSDRNREISSTFRSFYLELLVEKVLRGVTISNFSSGCRYVFDKGREASKYKIADPAGLGAQVNGIAAGTVAEAVDRFGTALSRAQRAEAYAAAGNVRAAVEEWRKVFGDYFPAYG